MPNMRRHILFGVVSLVVAASDLQAQVTIPDALIGSYDLTLQADPGSPIQDGSDVLLEISADGLLCADGIVFANPFEKNAVANRIFWSDAEADLEFSVDTAGPFVGVDLASADGDSYGTLLGAKVSNTPVACGAVAQSNDLFELAEAEYPDLFPASVFVFTQSDDNSDYRYYPATGLYLLVMDDGTVRLAGGDFGIGGIEVGNVEDILDADTLGLEAILEVEENGGLDYRISTYRLTLTNTRPFSPIPDGTTLTFVLTSDYRLCVGETILAPSTASNGQIVWNNPQARYFYRLGPEPVDGDVPDWDWESQGSFTLVDAGGFVYGEFQGERISLDAECGDRLGEHPDLAEIEVMFALAEQLDPDTFPGGPQTFSRRDDGVVSRHYEESGVTVYIEDREVTATGGQFGAGTYLGLLEDVITGFREQEITVSISAALSGTYGLNFTSAGPHTQIPSQQDLDLSLDQNGNLCLDGQLLMNPYLDPADPDVIVWESVAGGFSLQLDTSTTVANNISLVMKSSQGLVLGQMSGAKTLLLPVCGGLLGNGVDLDGAQRLFDSAENFMSDTFPPSALTYNRLEGGKLLRFYPETSVLVSVDTDQVAVSGGSFGSTPVPVGSIAELNGYFEKTYDVAPSGTATLKVSGVRKLSITNTPEVSQNVDLALANVQVPVANDITTLRQAVQNALGSELKSNWAASFTMVSDSANKLVFDAVITDEVKSNFIQVNRRYELRFTFDR